jgi:hypothetical protein
MAVRRVLYVDARGLTAWLDHGGAMHAEATFAAAGSDFAGYLEQRRDSHFYLLADVADEEFRVDDIPHVGRRDRRAIVERRLAQAHFATPLTAVLSCGRLREGRRDERLLLAALNDGALLPWLDALERAQAALAGVFTTAQLAGALPSACRREMPHLLVTTRTRAGLRQTFLERGRLRFSRLTPLAEDADAASACAAEATRLRQYMVGRSLAEGNRLTVLVLADPVDMPAYRTACRDTADLQFECVALADEAERAGLKGTERVASEALFAHVLLRNTPEAQFAGEDRRRSWRCVRADGISRRVAGGLLTASVLFAALAAAEGYRLRQDSTSVRADVAVHARRHTERMQSLPASPLPPERLRALVNRYDELTRASSGPAPAYRRLGAALADFPQIAVDRLEWRRADQSESEFAGFAQFDLHASLPAQMAGDIRGQLAVAEALADRLRAEPAVRVRTITRPFDAAPDKALKSDAVGTAAPPRFVLRTLVALRP